MSRMRTQAIVACLGCAVLSHCTTLDEPALTRAWSSPERPYEPAENAELGSHPGLDMGDSGEVVAVWAEAPDDVLAGRYLPQKQAWSARQKLNIGAGEVRDLLSVSMDAGGNAVAVWAQESTESIVYSNRSDNEGQWHPPAIRIDDGGTDATAPEDAGPQVSMNATGTAIAVWIESVGASDRVWANRYTQAERWEGPMRIDEAEAARASAPSVAVDRAGDAIAVWAMAEGATFDIWAARYLVGEGWRAAETIGHEDSVDAQAPRVGMDAQGHAVVVWRQGDRIWSNRFAAGSWLGAVRVDPANENDAGDPDVAVFPDGRAVAVWPEAQGERADVRSAQLTPNGGWTPPVVLEINDAGRAEAPRVAISADGTAVAVWKRAAGSAGEVIEAAALTRGRWSTPTPISPADQTVLGAPRVAMDPSGNATALWTAPVGPDRGVWVSHWIE